MPNRRNKNRKAGRRTPAPLADKGKKSKSFKEVAASLTNAIGKGLVPVIVGAAARAASSFIPAPLSGPNGPVTLPAAVGNAVHSGQPRSRTTGNGNMNVKHREFVADIAIEEAGFQLQYQFGVNPGNSGLFPWLSTVARRFELYRFRRLRVIYEPQTGTTSTGTIMLAIDYDASDPPPLDKTQMMSYKNAVRSPQWSGCAHDSAQADLHRLKTNYVLSGVAPPNSDIKTFDIGNLFVAVQSDGALQSAGELYVEYDVDLITPQIDNIVLSATIYGEQIPAETPNRTEVPFGQTPNITGSLPCSVLVEPDSLYQKLWIQQAGFWHVSANGGNMLPLADVDSSIATPNSGKVVASIGVVLPGTEGSVPSQTSINRVYQVIDPSVPQFFLGNEFTVDSTLASQCVMSITPIGQDALPNSDYQSPMSVPYNPRARLGRVRRT